MPDERAALRLRLYDLLSQHVAETVPTDDERIWLAAMLAADAGFAEAAAEIRRELTLAAKAEGMTLESIGRASGGITKQSVSRRVSRG